ncbi:MAG: M48 family metalloprotease [Rickettsiales bacterium]|nr:M48 family metalloprotease [Rickettsiales bacterium]
MKKLFFIFVLLSFCPFVPGLAATLISDTEIEHVMSELVAPLGRAADVRLRVHIVDDDDFNAFVSGGEDVFINSGTIMRVKNPSALQAIVAHELGHMAGGHIAQMSAKIRAAGRGSMIVQALGLAMVAVNPAAAMGVMAGAAGVMRTEMMSFSRDEERQADNYGIELMQRAKQDATAFIEVMKLMNDMAGAAESRRNTFNASHPDTSERLQNVREKLKDYRPSSVVHRPSYDLIRAKIIGYLGNQTLVTSEYPNRDTSAPALYARAIAMMRGGDLDGARAGARALISRDAANPYFYELLGDIEYQSGHYDDSVDAYDAALEKIKIPGPQIQSALGLVLAERNKSGDADRAIEMAKRSILSEPSPLAYMVLGRAEKSRGNDGISNWALAEYFEGTGDKRQARDFARRAMKQLNKSAPEYIKSQDILDRLSEQ